jgi:hypothetical protein
LKFRLFKCSILPTVLNLLSWLILKSLELKNPSSVSLDFMARIEFALFRLVVEVSENLWLNLGFFIVTGLLSRYILVQKELCSSIILKNSIEANVWDASCGTYGEKKKFVFFGGGIKYMSCVVH